MADFVVGSGRAGPALQQQQPVLLAYLPGFGYVVKAYKAVRAAGPAVERAAKATILLAGGLAEAVIKSAPHQGPGDNRANVGTGTFDGLTTALGDLGVRRAGSAAGVVPGETYVAPVWNADP